MPSENVTNLKVNVDMFHLMYSRKIGMTPQEYAEKLASDDTFKGVVQDAFGGYVVAIQSIRLQIIGGSKLSIEEIGPSAAKVRLGIGEWDINNTPKNAEVALDDFLLENNFLVSAS